MDGWMMVIRLSVENLIPRFRIELKGQLYAPFFLK